LAKNTITPQENKAPSAEKLLPFETVPHFEAVLFLSHFFDQDPWPLVACDQDKKRPTQALTFNRNGNDPLARAVNMLEWATDLNNKGFNIYFGPQPLKDFLRKKATKHDVGSVTHLIADIDPPKTVEDLDAWRGTKLEELKHWRGTVGRAFMDFRFGARLLAPLAA
jgi:hypothetical protein